MSIGTAFFFFFFSWSVFFIVIVYGLGISTWRDTYGGVRKFVHEDSWFSGRHPNWGSLLKYVTTHLLVIFFDRKIFEIISRIFFSHPMQKKNSNNLTNIW